MFVKLIICIVSLEFESKILCLQRMPLILQAWLLFGYLTGTLVELFCNERKSAGTTRDIHPCSLSSPSPSHTFWHRLSATLSELHGPIELHRRRFHFSVCRIEPIHRTGISSTEEMALAATAAVSRSSFLGNGIVADTSSSFRATATSRPGTQIVMTSNFEKSNPFADELKRTAAFISQPGKGILASDESNATTGKRLVQFA